MRKEIKNKSAIFPMPVLMIATYNDDGSVDVMNAAWGMMLEVDQIVLNLTESHATVENIKKRGAFTVSIADSSHVVEADYFGVVSSKKDKNKFKNSGLTAVKSSFVDAPIVEEFPICMECKFIEYGDFGVVGEVVNVTAKDEILDDGNVDISKIDAIAFDPFTNGYYKIGEKVGNAFKDGFKLKK